MSESPALNWLEISANGMNVICVLLAGRNHVATWWTGIVGCVLFGVLFYLTQLYADVALQGFFVVTGIIGWLRWRQRNGEPELRIAHTSPLLIAIGVSLAAVVTIAYGSVLHATTNAYAPYADSIVLAFSVLAQVLLMGRRVETWYMWLIVNTVAVPVYYSRGLTLTAVLYAGFWINACIALLHWRRAARSLADRSPTV